MAMERDIADRWCAVLHKKGVKGITGKKLLESVLDAEEERVFHADTGFIYFLLWYAFVYVKGRGEGKGWLRFCPDGKPRANEETGKDWSWQLDLGRQMVEAAVLLVLKARQIGLSFLVCAYVVWYCISQPDQQVVIIANKMGSAKNLMRRCLNVYSRLPQWMQDRHPLVNDAVSGMEFANGSRIEPLSSRSDTGRSVSATLVVIDETAFVENLGEVFASAEACADNGGKIIMISTANGTDNKFYEWCTDGILGDVIGQIKARNGDEIENHPVRLGLNDMTFVFLPWWMDPSRDAAWMESKERKYRGSLGTLRQEYPRDEEEAFISTGLGYFTQEKLLVHERESEQYDEVTRRGNLVWLDEASKAVAFMEDPTGLVHVHATAEEMDAAISSELPFVIGADAAGNQPWGDFPAASAVQVGGWDKERNIPIDSMRVYINPDMNIQKARQLVTIRDYMNSDHYAETLAMLGYWLGTALIVPEANGVGIAVINGLRRVEYPNIFVRITGDDSTFGEDTKMQFGFWSEPGKKQGIYAELERMQREMLLEIRDKFTIHEMRKVVFLGHSRIGAKEPNHDDRPDGLALAVGNLHRATKWRGHTPESEYSEATNFASFIAKQKSKKRASGFIGNESIRRS